jgi:hypothetical protein
MREYNARKYCKYRTKRIRQTLTKIGAKIADAPELSHKAKRFTDDSESLLIAIQQEIEDLLCFFRTI